MAVVYFASAVGSGRIKIGTAVCAKRRFRVSTDCPFPIKILCTVSDDIIDEITVQCAMQDLRVRGEWFLESPLLLRIIAMIAEGGSKADSAISFLDSRGRKNDYINELKYAEFTRRMQIAREAKESDRYSARSVLRANESRKAKERKRAKMRDNYLKNREKKRAKESTHA